jgi:hypothetical protein
MVNASDIARLRENWQNEVDSAAEYDAMAANEADPKISQVYSNLAKMEETHIAFWEERLRLGGISRKTTAIVAQPRAGMDSEAAWPRNRAFNDRS